MRIHAEDEGTRPSGAALLALVDTTDPAFMHIAAALREARDSGIKLTEETVRESVETGRRRQASEQPAPVATEPVTPDFPSIVYYVLRGPLVKIGTTINPASRFASLMPDDILAVEPGDRLDERQRHLQFRHLRVGTSEYFQQADDLTAHVRSIRCEYGAPNPDWPTTKNLNRSRADFFPQPPSATSPDMVTLGEAADAVGVRRGTVSGWIYRNLLAPVGKSGRGRPLYLLDDVKFLADRSADLTRSRVVRPQ
ncbi:GIY-YIG nuclease family protein [Streptomyces sp. NPDC088354]|uniref:GIY-YIG nuclease family protein n=1 Tax=Streptomyces sp. NPDC088354 TaxID=3365856 RepID=UPI00380915C4